MKKLGKFQIAVLKRNMQNVKPFEKRIERLEKIVADAQAEIEANKAQVERYEAIAKENLDITLVKYKIGTITTLEFRTAQLNYTNAQLRFAQAQYQAKMSEISLKALAGNLSL